MEDEVITPELLVLTCTEQSSGGCQLLRHLTYCNKALWLAGLQLREDPGDEPGYLNVVSVPGMRQSYPYCGDGNVEPALVMLQWLLEKHRCIVSLEANYDTLHATKALVEAHASSSNLLRLVTFGYAKDPFKVNEELKGHELVSAYLQQMPCESRIDIPTGLLLKDDARIVSLDLSKLNMGPSRTKTLIDALIKNGTVEELSTGAYVLYSRHPGKPLNLFVAFLLKENATLRKLSIKGRRCRFQIATWRSLARAIANVGTLENLTLEVSATKQKCVLFLEAVFHSQSLRSLTFLPDPSDDDPHDYGSSENMNDQSWIFALQNNRVMETLDLNVHWLCSANCCLLLEAIGRKSNLIGVTLRKYKEGLKDICRIMEQAGLNERIRIEERSVVSDEGDDLIACQQLASVDIDITSFVSVPFAAYNVLRVATTCPHITSACVYLYSFDVGIFASLAACILESSTLRKIKLVIEFAYEENGDRDVASQSLSKVHNALSSNTSLNKIDLICDHDFMEDDCKALGDAPSKNRYLHEFSVLDMRTEYFVAFMDRLLTRLDQNYNLVLLDVPYCVDAYAQMRAAQEMVRRNCSLVERATRFVMGTHHRDFACAFETLSEEPVLLMNVRKKATVSDQAESMVNEARNLLRNAKLDTYMQLAGVVKRAVRCNYREDGGRQLDRLPYDCWVHIRRHLKIADVVQP